MTSYRPSGVGGGKRKGVGLPGALSMWQTQCSARMHSVPGIFSVAPWRCYPHFIDEVQRGEGTCPRSHSKMGRAVWF